jgi:hypothetical protein
MYTPGLCIAGSWSKRETQGFNMSDAQLLLLSVWLGTICPCWSWFSYSVCTLFHGPIFISLDDTGQHKHYTHEDGCTGLRVLHLGTSWMWMVSFTPLPLYPRGKSPWHSLNRRLGGPKKRRKILSLPALELRPLCLLARCQSLYRLRFPSPVLHSMF